MRLLLFIRSIIWTAVIAVILAILSIAFSSIPLGLASITFALLSQASQRKNRI